MKNENLFSVSRFKNRNGVFSFRVDGRLNGVRIRRNFKTQEEAATEKAALELKALQLASDLRPVIAVRSKMNQCGATRLVSWLGQHRVEPRFMTPTNTKKIFAPALACQRKYQR